MAYSRTEFGSFLDEMAKDVQFWRSDLARMLLSIEAASAMTAVAGDESSTYLAAYRAGYKAAICAVALALGLGELLDNDPSEFGFSPPQNRLGNPKG